MINEILKYLKMNKLFYYKFKENNNADDFFISVYFEKNMIKICSFSGIKYINFVSCDKCIGFNTFDEFKELIEDFMLYDYLPLNDN